MEDDDERGGRIKGKKKGEEAQGVMMQSLCIRIVK